MTKVPIALRALPQQVGEDMVQRPPSTLYREDFQRVLPQLVGEVPEGRWGTSLTELVS